MWVDGAVFLQITLITVITDEYWTNDAIFFYINAFHPSWYIRVMDVLKAYFG